MKFGEIVDLIVGEVSVDVVTGPGKYTTIFEDEEDIERIKTFKRYQKTWANYTVKSINADGDVTMIVLTP